VAELFVRTEDDVPVLAIVVDPEASVGERAVAELGSRGYEGDDVRYLVQTDGWAERSRDGATLTVDVVAHAAVLESLEVDTSALPERSEVDPTAIRLLRVTGELNVATLSDATAVYFTPADKITEDDWPLILAPPPDVRG